MPTYVYKFVETGETIEIQQAFTDDTLTEVAHPDSGQVMAVKKVFQPVGVTFRGSGFFKTDNRGSKPTTGESSGGGDSTSSSDSKSGDSKSGDSKSGDSKSGDSKSGDSKSSDSKSGDSKSVTTPKSGSSPSKPASSPTSSG